MSDALSEIVLAICVICAICGSENLLKLPTSVFLARGENADPSFKPVSPGSPPPPWKMLSCKEPKAPWKVLFYTEKICGIRHQSVILTMADSNARGPLGQASPPGRFIVIAIPSGSTLSYSPELKIFNRVGLQSILHLRTP